jgi:two-component sensor histidine kinase
MFFVKRTLVPTRSDLQQPAINAAHCMHMVVGRLSIFHLIILFSAHVTGFAQEYGYRHYNVKDGLAGSKVYHINQDRDGFIWFATETGVSRFDGTHFKNFTINDGLPDNEIVRIYSDSKDRVWLVPFKHSISYYYRGKIYNQQNDSVLKKMSLCDYILSICESRNGDVLLLDPCNLYRLQSPYSVQLVRQFPKYSVAKISVDDSGQYDIVMTNRSYKADAKNFTFRDTMPENFKGGTDQVIVEDKLICWLTAFDKLHVKSGLYNIEYDYAIPPANTICRINDSIICLNTTNGTIWLNIIRRNIEKHFLAGKNISNSFTDREGGMWFATFNDGIYQLGAALFNTISRESAGGQKLGVYALQKFKGKICAASDLAHLQVIQKDSIQLISLSSVYPPARRGPVTAIKKAGDNLAVGFISFVGTTKDYTEFHIKNLHGSVKDVEFKNNTTIIAATSNALFEYSLTDLSSKSIWLGRTTCVLCRNDSIYFGTLNGLYLLKPDKTVFYFGDTSVLLQNRIVDLVEGPNGTVWVATGSEGIIELKENRVIRHIKHDETPGNNISRCIALDKEFIWIGTDKGLYKIDGKNPASITKYTASDGMPSDIINTILIDGDTVYAGTPEGIVYFNKNTRFPSPACDLKLLDIFINGKKTTDTGRFLLNYGNNSIRFDYVAISFKSGGDIVYSYRIEGLDSAWKTTRQTTLELISLPPGKYSFQLFATNKFGVTSVVYSAQLSVQAPFWQTAWFIIVCILVSVLLTWLVLNRRIKSIRAKEAIRQQFEQRLAALEQKALRAQMNPHFIFNCLNSIQEFIIDKDVLSANKYLSQFARLIRQTLDNSFQSQISIEDEINYLNTYLNLEQMRFRNRFNYTIQADKSMLPVQSMIPGMVIQPYVENAVRHGLPPNQDDRGQIDIHFSQSNAFIYCSIRDNGMGRKQTLAIKATKAGGHQSRGMALTQERIDLMNKHLDANIQITIIDHENREGIATGTEVIITFPLIKKITV